MQTSNSTAAPAASPFFAEPTSLGLFGLSIGCAALLPIVFGVKEALTPDAIHMVAWFCLLFGAGCQFLAGMMSFANKNMLGGTLLTTFSFNWVMNWWALSELAAGRPGNTTIILSVDCCFMLIFLVMTYAFAFYSKMLFLLLVDIDLLYGMRIAKEVFSAQKALAMPLAWATVGLMLIALYIALSIVLTTASGKTLLPMGGPIFKAAVQPVPATDAHPTTEHTNV